jgi:hypothetical protein
MNLQTKVFGVLIASLATATLVLVVVATPLAYAACTEDPHDGDAPTGNPHDDGDHGNPHDSGGRHGESDNCHGAQ